MFSFLCLAEAFVLQPTQQLLYMLRHKAGQEGRGEILLENSSMR